MQNVSNNIIDVKKEVENKVVNYLKAHGLSKRDEVNDNMWYGIEMGADYCLWVEGSFDNIHIDLRYEGFKPEKIVKREILAMDERIDSINITREYPQQAFDDEMSNSSLDTIFVMIDGQLQQTTYDEYIRYKLRNRVFKK